MATVLCFSTVDWDYLWHRPQAVMSSLAQDGHRVLYVDTIGLRSPRLQDAGRVLARLLNRARGGLRGTSRPHPGIQVVSPILLPWLDSRLVRRVNVGLLVRRLRRLLHGMDRRDLMIWVYLPTATVLACVERLPHRLLVYEAIDALESNPAGVSRDYTQSERTLLARADLVLATSPALFEAKTAHNANTHFVPPGVAGTFFADASVDAQGEAAAGILPPELAGIDRPRVGFFGTIDHRLDLDLVRTLARRHPDWSFVLIGPARCDVNSLSAAANVHLLGPLPHVRLVPYLRHMDVFLLPYVVDDFTRAVYPAKIYECLAVGRPVVATRLPALEEKEFAGLVHLAADQGEFEAALTAALAEDDPTLAARRRERARENSWEARYRQIRSLVRAAGG